MRRVVLASSLALIAGALLFIATRKLHGGAIVLVRVTGTAVAATSEQPIQGTRVLVAVNGEHILSGSWREAEWARHESEPEGYGSDISGIAASNEEGHFRVELYAMSSRIITVWEVIVLGKGKVPPYFGVGGIHIAHPEFADRLLRPESGAWKLRWEEVGPGKRMISELRLGRIPLERR